MCILYRTEPVNNIHTPFIWESRFKIMLSFINLRISEFALLSSSIHAIIMIIVLIRFLIKQGFL